MALPSHALSLPATGHFQHWSLPGNHNDKRGQMHTFNQDYHPNVNHPNHLFYLVSGNPIQIYIHLVFKTKVIQMAANHNMDCNHKLKMGITLILQILIFSTSLASSAIMEEADCSKQGRVFKRLSSTVYKCRGGYKSFECYPGHAIPPWVTLAKRDPCVCMERRKRGRKELLCPNPPAFSENILPKDNNSRIVIKDTGCPEAPFFKYARTFRTALPASYPVKLTKTHRFVSPQEECKYKCLVDPKCVGVQYGPTGMYGYRGRCTAFRYFPEMASEFTPNKHFNYFWRVKCKSEPEGRQGVISKVTEVPQTTIPPPVTRPTPFPGLLLRDTHQMGGYLNGTGISEKACYFRCTQMQQCQAADYHKILRQCWLHHSTSCQTHVKSHRKCCNHFKKNIKSCRTVIAFA